MNIFQTSTSLLKNLPNALQGAPRYKLPLEGFQFWRDSRLSKLSYFKNGENFSCNFLSLQIRIFIDRSSTIWTIITPLNSSLKLIICGSLLHLSRNKIIIIQKNLLFWLLSTATTAQSSELFLRYHKIIILKVSCSLTSDLISSAVLYKFFSGSTLIITQTTNFFGFSWSSLRPRLTRCVLNYFTAIFLIIVTLH